MDPYVATLAALVTALVSQALAAGWCAEMASRRGQTFAEQAVWMAFAIAALLAALHHGYTLELAFRTGLFDLRQGVLGALSGVLFAAAARGLRQRLS
jgi:NADPH-dependent 2,4-dienoyl-CoA reductase/sulfur reductase-like enzyme